MMRAYSEKMRLDARAAVAEAIARDGAVDVPAIAEAVRIANIAENVAREDVELLVMHQAQSLGVPMTFSTTTPGSYLSAASK